MRAKLKDFAFRADNLQNFAACQIPKHAVQQGKQRIIKKRRFRDPPGVRCFVSAEPLRHQNGRALRNGEIERHQREKRHQRAVDGG